MEGYRGRSPGKPWGTTANLGEPADRTRPIGISSRLRPGDGERRVWPAPNGSEVALPVVLDIVAVDPDGTMQWSVEATVDLVGAEPCITSVHARSAQGLDTAKLQQSFRWSTPLDVVRHTVPGLLERGRDPYTHDYPIQGYPSAAILHRTRAGLSDAFLEDIARQYLETGRGYAATISAQYGVSARTVTSWIELARARGILTSRGKGAFGGEIVPESKRRIPPRTPD